MGTSLVQGTVLGKIQVLEKCWPVLALGRRKGPGADRLQL